MNESIHGHQVMEMMAESQQTYNKQSLKLAIATKFGATCSKKCATYSISGKN